MNILDLLFPKKVVTDKIYNNYINTGDVPESILNMIAKKVIGKQKLTDQENSIFFGETARINKIINDIHKSNNK